MHNDFRNTFCEIHSPFQVTSLHRFGLADFVPKGVYLVSARERPQNPLCGDTRATLFLARSARPILGALAGPLDPKRKVLKPCIAADLHRPLHYCGVEPGSRDLRTHPPIALYLPVFI